jgi:hypothetical protein
MGVVCLRRTSPPMPQSIARPFQHRSDCIIERWQAVVVRCVKLEEAKGGAGAAKKRGREAKAYQHVTIASCMTTRAPFGTNPLRKNPGLPVRMRGRGWRKPTSSGKLTYWGTSTWALFSSALASATSMTAPRRNIRGKRGLFIRPYAACRAASKDPPRDLCLSPIGINRHDTTWVRQMPKSALSGFIQSATSIRSWVDQGSGLDVARKMRNVPTKWVLCPFFSY